MRPTDQQLRDACRAVDDDLMSGTGYAQEQIAELRALFEPERMSVRLEIASRIMAGFAAVPEATATPLNVVVEGALCWADALIAADRESSK